MRKFKTKKISTLIVLFIIAVAAMLSNNNSEIVSPDAIPAYSGLPYVEVNANVPFFTEDEITDRAFEKYDELEITIRRQELLLERDNAGGGEGQHRQRKAFRVADFEI